MVILEMREDSTRRVNEICSPLFLRRLIEVDTQFFAVQLMNIIATNSDEQLQALLEAGPLTKVLKVSIYFTLLNILIDSCILISSDR